MTQKHNQQECSSPGSNTHKCNRNLEFPSEWKQLATQSNLPLPLTTSVCFLSDWFVRFKTTRLAREIQLKVNAQNKEPATDTKSPYLSPNFRGRNCQAAAMVCDWNMRINPTYCCSKRYHLHLELYLAAIAQWEGVGSLGRPVKRARFEALRALAICS